MTDIVTLTMNPAVDVSTSAERVVSEHKLRCSLPSRDPGGGGINVARVATRLGADVKALYPRGGETGALLRRLIDAEGILPPFARSRAGRPGSSPAAACPRAFPTISMPGPRAPPRPAARG